MARDLRSRLTRTCPGRKERRSVKIDCAAEASKKTRPRPRTGSPSHAKAWGDRTPFVPGPPSFEFAAGDGRPSKVGVTNPSSSTNQQAVSLGIHC